MDMTCVLIEEAPDLAQMEFPPVRPQANKKFKFAVCEYLHSNTCSRRSRCG
jgi:hypothetical protein